MQVKGQSLMAQHLWTGMWTLNVPDKDRQFGAVGAFGPPTGAGMVLLHLRTNDVATYVEQGAINAMVPEDWARELASRLSLVTTQIAHLRSLHRAGHLSAEALHEDAQFVPDGDRIEDGGDDESLLPIHEDAPPQTHLVSLSVLPDCASLIYASATGDVRISIEGMDAFRSSRAPAHPTTQGQSLAPFISLVRRSRWKRERDAIERVEEMDEQPVQRHHYRFRFGTILVEAIASQIVLNPVSEQSSDVPTHLPGKS
jgi:hypothetical protein